MGGQPKLKNNKGMNIDNKNIIIRGFSALIAAIAILTIVFLDASLKQDRNMGLNVSIFTIKNLVIFIVLFLLCNCVFQWLLKFVVTIEIRDKDCLEKSHRMVFIQAFILNIVCWGVWFWLYFPGTGMNDTINCIMSYRNDNQPLVYQLFIYYGIHGLTKFTSNMTNSYAILTAVQMGVMSFVIAWIAKWLCKKGVKRLFINLFMLYYALMPVVADYSITLVKNTMFSICMAAIIPFLYEIILQHGEVIKNKKFYIAFFIVLTGICTLRSNGKFIVVFILLLLLIPKINNRRYFISILVLVIMMNGMVSFGEKKLIAGDVSFRESISIPLVQIGAVLAENGYISEEDKEVLGNLLPLEVWRDTYCFWFSDSIKFNGNFNNQWLNENKAKFIDTWFSVLKDNLGIYVKAYLCHTFGLWNVSPYNPTDYTQSYFTRINNNTGDDSIWGEFCTDKHLINRDINHRFLSKQINTFLATCFRINLVLRPGIMFWVIVGFMLILCVYKQYQVCFIFLPCLLNWITMMIAAPGSYIYRYSFYLVLSLPLLFIIMLLALRKMQKE